MPSHSINDQMFDVMCTLTSDLDGGYDGRRIAAWIQAYFKSPVCVSAAFEHTASESILSTEELRYARKLANAQGCYNAANWLLNVPYAHLH